MLFAACPPDFLCKMSMVGSTEKLLEETPIRNLILRLGIPAMLGQFFNILYSIVDRIFVGQIAGVGETALASIGVCAPALAAVSAFAYMVGIGGASSMSIYLGQRDHQRARDILGNAIFLLLTIAVVVTTLLLFVKRPLLYVLGCSDTMYPYAEVYFTIYICGTVASLLGIGLNQFLLAQGFAKQGMLSVVIGATMNAILDPLPIFVCGMGVAGAAVATVISQCCMPVYWYSIPSQIKAVIDRIYSLVVGGKDIAGKECALIACCEEEDRTVLDGVRIPMERTAALNKWKMVGEVLIPGVLNVGDIDKTDGCQQAVALANKI